jgi:hypothetical protein
MNKRIMMALAGILCLTSACDTEDFLDVNTNPNAPQVVTANLYLPPMIHWMVTGQQFDGRFVGMYNQEWVTTTSACYVGWARMGHDQGTVATGCGGGGDNGGQQWRDVYWSMGQNLIDMMQLAEAEQRWDLLGVGYVLKAYGFQSLAGLHGEIIVKEAVNQTKFNFSYDSMEVAYAESRRLLGEAITNLSRTDGAVDAAYLGRTDKLFNGDRTKWLKLAHGLLAMNLSHYSNKASYNPAQVIANVDKSFASQADDALFVFPNASTDNADRNFNGPTRANHTVYRQTQFIVGLMNGTQLGVTDPRMPNMLVQDSANTTYRGLDINTNGFGALTAPQQPRNPFGYVAAPLAGSAGRYLFSDKVRFPVMTHAQLQFIKAEAAYRAGDRATALSAYRSGIVSHFAFVNARNSEDGFRTAQISAAERDAYLNDPAISPSAAGLTLTHIMSQKYIAQWAWSHNEIWMDLRRYHYTDIDPASGRQVFPGFTPPAVLFVDNGGKVVQRLRPRFNSEYVWNREGLDKIGGLALDYQTVPLWITQP